MKAGKKVRFGGSVVWGSEEKNAVGAGVDGMEMGNLGCGAAFGIRQCLSRFSASVSLASDFSQDNEIPDINNLPFL